MGDDDRPKGPTFTAHIDVVESMGSDLFVHFATEAAGSLGGELESVGREIAPAGGTPSGATIEVVARLDASSRVRRGSDAQLWFDATRILFFDADSGENLTRRESVAADDGGALAATPSPEPAQPGR